MELHTPDDQRLARIGDVHTAALADVLDRHGLRHQTLPPELLPLSRGSRMAGPIYAIEGRPHPDHDYDTSIRLILEMLGSIRPGHIAVYQTNDTSNAHLGELSVTSLLGRGCLGAVIDGGCRDTAMIRETGFPVFCRYTTPQDCVPRWEVTGHGNITIEVGDVTIGPGDWLVADSDGAIVIPAERVSDILDEARAKVATENSIRTAVLAGALPLEAYEQYGTF